MARVGCRELAGQSGGECGRDCARSVSKRELCVSVCVCVCGECILFIYLFYLFISFFNLNYKHVSKKGRFYTF